MVANLTTGAEVRTQMDADKDVMDEGQEAVADPSPTNQRYGEVEHAYQSSRMHL